MENQCKIVWLMFGTYAMSQAHQNSNRDKWLDFFWHLVSIGTLAQFDKIIIGLAVIKLFQKMPNYLEIVCLKCQILENCKGKRIPKIWWKARSFLLGQSPTAKYPTSWQSIISSHFLQKEALKKVVKSLIMLEIQTSKTKEPSTKRSCL